MRLSILLLLLFLLIYSNSNAQNHLKNDYKKIRNDWLYNPNRKDIPPDLGYFIGFKICEKYYNESSDKIKAIEFILNGNNYSKIIETSHYNGGK